jgi:molecular chaperone DnaJ
MAKDYYQLLGVERNATKDEIHKAYRKLAKKHHPDRNKGDRSAEAKFKDIGEAYSVLGDDQKRRQYDLMGSASFQSPGGQEFWDQVMGGAGRRPRGGEGQTFTYENLGDLGDLFSQFFGRESPFEAHGGFDGQHPVRGEDRVAQVDIPFETSIHGGHISVTVPHRSACPSCGGSGAAPGSKPRACETCGGSGMVQASMGGFAVRRPCPHCLGRGRIGGPPCGECRGTGQVERTRTLKVRVPAGVSQGQRIRLAGQGEPGVSGAPSGDLYIEVQVAPGEGLRREGNDVYSEIQINILQAALGTRAEVGTVQGKLMLSIPAGTESGAKLRLRGKGVRSEDRGTGDHYVVVHVQTPKNLTDEQKRLLEQFGKAAGITR